jgi:uncharacterized protein (DUF934 family)
MALLRRDRIVTDRWTKLQDGETIPANGAVIVSLDRWRHDRLALLESGCDLGITLASDQPPELVADDIARFGVICIDFPKFTDGRGYTHARLLRARYDYTGEIRAIGNVLRDQILFMRRCGIDVFEIPDDATPAKFAAGLNEITVRYQPAADHAPTVLQQRHPASDAKSGIAGSWTY